MSSRPCLPTVKSTMAFTSASLATSARTNAASPPSFLISSTTCAPSFSRRPVRTTLAPARANSIAVVLPMPEVPPVTSATFPVSFPLFILFPFTLWFSLVRCRDLGCGSRAIRLFERRLHANFDRGQSFRDRTILFRVDHKFLKRRVVDGRNGCRCLEINLSDGERVARFFESHVRAGMNVTRHETSAGQSRGQRHREAPGVRRAQQFLRVCGRL